MPYFAIRHRDYPNLVRVEAASDAIEALYIAFGRDRRGGLFEAKNLDLLDPGTKINDPVGWEII